VIAQKQRPLAAFGDGRCLLEDIDDGETIFHADSRDLPYHVLSIPCVARSHTASPGFDR
jgi:hypothetical protein